MDDNYYFGELNDIYGAFLTENQRNIIESYYDYDLSLSEIGSNLGISSQAVSDAKRKAEAALKAFENNLKLFRIKNELIRLSTEGTVPYNLSESLRKLADSIGG